MTDEQKQLHEDLEMAEQKVKEKYLQELAQEGTNPEQSVAEPALGPIESLMSAIQKQELKFRARAPLRPFDVLNEFIIKDKYSDNKIPDEEQKLMELAFNFKPFNLEYINGPRIIKGLNYQGKFLEDELLISQDMQHAKSSS